MKGGGGGALYSAIFSSHFGVSFLRQFGDNVGHFCHVSQWMRAHLRINACHVPTATVFPEDVCRVCTFRSLCASKNCGAGTLKHGTFEFERGRPRREGGCSATVCRFGENPGVAVPGCFKTNMFGLVDFFKMEKEPLAYQCGLNCVL